MVGIVGARLDDGDDRPGIDEPRQVVDVAVGVVAVDAPAEPDDVAHAEKVGEDPLQGRPVEPRVARLDRAEQALLGRQQRAPAVDVEGPPFHHDPPPSGPWAAIRGTHRRSPSRRASRRGIRSSW